MGDGKIKEIYLSNWSFIDGKKRIRGIEVNKNKVGSSKRPIPTKQSEFMVDSIIRVIQPECTQNMISVLTGKHFQGGRRRTKNKKNKRKTIKHKAKRQTRKQRKQRKQPSRRRR